MSNSYYCGVCGQEMLEIKNADSLISNIADILILCEECGKNNKLCISAEKNIKFISPGKCKWELTENPTSFRVKFYIKTSCGHKTNADGCFCKFCPFCGKETEEI